jgi:small-conductance mechanosensitive channel
MLDLHLQYDPNMTIDTYVTRPTNDPVDMSIVLKHGLMPQNLVQISEISTNFRDAVINTLITNSDANETVIVLQLLSAAVSSTPDEAVNTVKAYSEYLAPLSFAWGETVLATRSILRNKPEKAGNFLSTVANALNKKMDSEMFKSLIMNSTASAIKVVELEIAQGKY